MHIIHLVKYFPNEYLFTGIRFTIDLTNPKGERIKNVMVWNSFETKESCTEMAIEKSYNVVMNDFIAWGGNNYPDLREKKYKIRQGTKITSARNCHIFLIGFMY